VRARTADEGSVLLLVVGMVVLLVLLVTVVVDVTALFLARKDLLAAADGAALAGAQAVDAERLYTEGVSPGLLPLDPTEAERAARAYLAEAGVGEGLAGLQVEVVATGTTVTVRLDGVARLPFVSDVTPGAAAGVRVSASASASTAVVSG
jgi:Flp pilus assembly protein TadG